MNSECYMEGNNLGTMFFLLVYWYYTFCYQNTRIFGNTFKNREYRYYCEFERNIKDDQYVPKTCIEVKLKLFWCLKKTVFFV